MLFRSAAGAATGAAVGAMGGPIGSVGGAVIGGLSGAVTQIIGGSPRVVCTKLVEVGLLSSALHMAEAEWSLNHKSREVIRGYHWWAVPFVRFMDGKPRLCKALAVVVRPYARYLARRAGSPLGRFSLHGMAVDIVGSAVCWCIGKLVKYDKYCQIWDREDSERLTN